MPSAPHTTTGKARSLPRSFRSMFSVFSMRGSAGKGRSRVVPEPLVSPRARYESEGSQERQQQQRQQPQQFSFSQMFSPVSRSSSKPTAERKRCFEAEDVKVPRSLSEGNAFGRINSNASQSSAMSSMSEVLDLNALWVPVAEDGQTFAVVGTQWSREDGSQGQLINMGGSWYIDNSMVSLSQDAQLLTLTDDSTGHQHRYMAFELKLHLLRPFQGVWTCDNEDRGFLNLDGDQQSRPGPLVLRITDRFWTFRDGPGGLLRCGVHGGGVCAGHMVLVRDDSSGPRLHVDCGSGRTVVLRPLA